VNEIDNTEALPPTDSVLNTFVGTLKAIAQQEADTKKQRLDAKASDVRGVIEPRLAEARALIADIEAAQKDAAPIVKPFAEMDWAALRKYVPVTIKGETDTRTTITLLERAVREARELLAAQNATTLRSTVARIEQLQQYQSLSVPHELLGLLDYEMAGSKELANSLRAKTRVVSVLSARLQEDINSGEGLVPEPPPPVEEIVLPLLPQLNEPADRAVTDFDPLNYEHAATQPKDDIMAGPFYKVRAPKEGRR
jgi:hypothetical protein